MYGFQDTYLYFVHNCLHLTEYNVETKQIPSLFLTVKMTQLVSYWHVSIHILEGYSVP